MDGFDLFRKLGVGTKFDFKRFKSDANVLNVRKAHNNNFCSVIFILEQWVHLKNFSVDQINNQCSGISATTSCFCVEVCYKESKIRCWSWTARIW